MTDSHPTNRTRVLALTFAAFGAMVGCGGGEASPPPVQSTTATSTGGEQPAATTGETPSSTPGTTTNADVNPDTACGHGACT